MRRLIQLTLLLLGWFAHPDVAWAIPAFARRYETSCQTCHVAFPRLTPFGEAFRWSGYRFPEDGDEGAQKRDPVPLGNDAQKERWPKVVFPGAIPWDVPLSIVLSGTAGYGTEFEGHHHGAMSAEDMAGMDEDSHEAQLQLSTLVDMTGLRAAAALGDHISALVAVNLGGMSVVEVERANLLITPLRHPTDLRIRVGAFEPELHGVSIHRGLVGHMLRLTTKTVGDSPWAPEPTQTGLELSGVVAHRVGWVLGTVENATSGVYLAKDAYARGFLKLGGMPVDGSGGLAGSAAWRERSFTLGASAYDGRAQISTDTSVQDDPFLRVGVDGHAILDDLSLDLVAAHQRDGAPWAGDSADVTTDRVFAELTWVALPVVFPTLRFEGSRETAEGEPPSEPDWLGMIAVNGVIRPNVLLRTQAAMGASPGEKPNFRFVTVSWSTAF